MLGWPLRADSRQRALRDRRKGEGRQGGRACAAKMPRVGSRASSRKCLSPNSRGECQRFGRFCDCSPSRGHVIGLHILRMKKIILAALLATTPLFAQEAKPLKVLLITGGCCHDYAKQKDILKQGIEERINAVVDQSHSDDKGTKPPLAILGNPDYAKGYDVVIHDECAADIKDPKIVEGVLAPHKDGIPGVNLHCAMHCYRVGNPGKPQTSGTPEALWFDYLGLQSSGHGPQKPIT